MKDTSTNLGPQQSAPTPAIQSRGQRSNTIWALQALGQSVWLDYLRRSLFTSGEFRRLVGEDGLRGVTSNRSILELRSAMRYQFGGHLEKGRTAGSARKRDAS